MTGEPGFIDLSWGKKLLKALLITLAINVIKELLQMISIYCRCFVNTENSFPLKILLMKISLFSYWKFSYFPIGISLFSYWKLEILLIHNIFQLDPRPHNTRFWNWKWTTNHPSINISQFNSLRIRNFLESKKGRRNKENKNERRSVHTRRYIGIVPKVYFRCQGTNLEKNETKRIIFRTTSTGARAICMKGCIPANPFRWNVHRFR